MTITQQQAIEALESVHGAIFKAYGSPAYRVLRQYIEQGAGAGADGRALLAEQARTEPDSFTLLARVRDALPVPERGSTLEQLWAAAMADPESVPDYVRASFAQTHKAEDAPSEAELLNAIKSGKAVLVDWPMEPSTPEEALELMDMMDAEYAKTMGKPAPDAEMGNSMRRVRHMACDLWAWQKDTMREAFNEAVRAERKA